MDEDEDSGLGSDVAEVEDGEDVEDEEDEGEDGEDESGGGDWGRGELFVAIFKIC